jgi:hypothetical protein
LSQVVTEEVPAGTDVSGSSIAQLQGMLRGGEKATLPEEVETPVIPETPAKPAKAKTEDETAPPAGAEETTQETEKKAQKGINKRFSDLTGEIRDLKAQLAAKQAAEGKPGAAIPPAIDPSEPVAANFETYEAYVKALTKYEIAQAGKATEAKATAKTMAESWEARKAEARTRIDDFDEFAGADIPISAVMNAAILESDSGADIAYFLGKNPEEAARIAKLPPVSAAVAIGKIEASLAKATPEKPKPAAVKLPPKPPATVSAGSTPAPSNDLNDPKTSMETFVNIARKNLRRPSF